MDSRYVDREFSFEDSTGTFVGFRVQEELSGIGSTTAVGRTPEVSGTMTIDGTTVTAVSVEANMDAITTNDSRRDDNARGALDTDEFPTATFVLTQPIELGDDRRERRAGGRSRRSGISRSTARRSRSRSRSTHSSSTASWSSSDRSTIVFADYGVSVPDAPIVVSAEDHGIIELQLFFTIGLADRQISPPASHLAPRR